MLNTIIRACNKPASCGSWRRDVVYVASIRWTRTHRVTVKIRVTRDECHATQRASCTPRTRIARTLL